MPFGLCNAPATFQMCMLAIFHDMIEESVEVFMDDFSVFGNSFDTCLNNLDKMLQRCKDAHLVLNWEKCHFMVKEGIVLGHKVSRELVEKFQTDGITAASCRKRQWCHPNFLREQRKEVQSLNGKLAGLNRFLSKSADKSLPLFKTLKKCTKKGDFRWTTEAEEAFTQLKQHIAALPTN
ncbi:reverse transcriptase domain-containing protein [Tanacetum coccineum]|uniref:Reverse transcriptase domain-containing protein n=1 Tax=Tanacetum coccineum TaxID=301880 RepID=A0ABQ5J7D3_9ASTR